MPIIFYISKGDSYLYTGKVEIDAVETWVNDREYELIDKDNKDLVKKIPKIANWIDRIVFWAINKLTANTVLDNNAKTDDL